MLTYQERLILAESLKKLRTKLQPYSDRLMNQLPVELQQAVRSHKTLRPITSSGLEHVDQLIGRINWVVFYLTNPHFPEGFKTAPQPAQPPQPPAPATPPPPVTPAAPAAPTTPPELDFGPFDPRSV